MTDPLAERVVLLSPEGRPVGEADKATVHGATTPYHLAFSCYAFDVAGRLLVTQRALSKQTWPGTWTNTCCGHPAPGEPPAEGVRRRLGYELGLEPERLRVALTDFSYRASAGGVEEHELCPVFLCRVVGQPTPNPAEVERFAWMPWEDFVRAALQPDSTLSPWARLQVRRLEDEGHVERFLAHQGLVEPPEPAVAAHG